MTLLHTQRGIHLHMLGVWRRGRENCPHQVPWCCQSTTAWTVSLLPAQWAECSPHHKPHACTVKSLFKQDKYFQKDGIMLCSVSTDSVLKKRGTKIQVVLNHHGRWTSLFLSARSIWLMQQRESYSQETCLECLKTSVKSTRLWWHCIFWITFLCKALEVEAHRLKHSLNYSSKLGSS